jgi:A/G-specific adenine glycosylase
MIPEGGRWAGLWDFPRTTNLCYSSAKAAASGLSDQMGMTISSGKRLATIRHTVTRYRIQLHVHAASLIDSNQAPSRPWRFVSLKQMESMPMSVTGRKIVQLLQRDWTH